MKFRRIIEQITNEFIAHWNNHDVDQLAAYLSNDIVVYSPNIKKLFPEVEGSTLRNKEKVMDYWKKLNREYFFTMKLTEFTSKGKTIKCVLDIGSRQTKMIAIFSIDEYGKFIKMDISYKDH